ncbi:MAG: GH92 family glycosyl hydrolase [Clostridia bacterium]|nr:GH92 family glycosyl hydrolase [Clostridia bacterium]
MNKKRVQRLIAGILAAIMLTAYLPAATAEEAAAPKFQKVLEVEAAKAGSTGSIQTADKLIDGSGMSGDGLDATHDNSDGASSMWHIEENAADPQTDTAWVEFDMGSLQKIGKIYVWNHNQNHPTVGLLTDRGLKDIKVEYSADGVNWTELRGSQADPSKEYPYTLAKASGSSAEPATNLVGGEPIEVNKLARYVKITADPVAGQGNYGSAAVYGMSEVRFAEMDSATVDQNTIYVALKKYFSLYEEEYTPATWSVAEAAAAEACTVFNGGSSAGVADAIDALEDALDALEPSGVLHVSVIPVAGVKAGSQTSIIVPENVINGSGMSGDGFDAIHAKAAGAAGAWHTNGSGSTGRTDAWIQFDFGKLTTVGEMHIWNMNQGTSDRGMKNVKIETSLDGEIWEELRNAAQISNTGDYPYTFAKATTDNSPASNLANGEPVYIDRVVRYVKITADPTLANGTHGSSDQYGLCEVRFGTPDAMTEEQVRIDAALDRLTAKNSRFYTADSWASYLAEGYNLVALYAESGLTAEEATAALTAFETAEAALVKVKMEELVIDFESVEGIVPVEEDASETEMTVAPENGWLKITGEQTADGHGWSYFNIISDVNLVIEEDSRLTYIISPKMDKIYNGEYPSQHVAVDLKFSDGTYLSDLGVLDDNCVGIHPNAQGESKTQIMCGSSVDTTAARFVAKNLITVCLGEWEQVLGKTVTDILVGYENENGYDNYIFETAIDDIKLKAAEKTYEKLTDYVLTTAGTINFQHNDSALGCYSFGKSVPFVALPQSFNLWAPQNVNATNHLRTIYNYEREYLKSFTCSHQANYHIGDMINWNFAITNGGTEEDTSFDRANEVAKAHYYAVEFDIDSTGRAAGTKAELTTTEHGAALRVTYDESLTTRGLILKGINELSTGSVTSLVVDQETNSFEAVVTSTINHGIDKMYVYGTFDAEITSYDDTTVYFGADVVTMKTATSFISAEQAKANYEQELKDKTFMEVYTEAEQIWLEKLGTIEIEGATETQMISFYTALYRSFLYPNHLGEYTGEGEADGWQYRGIYGEKGVQDGKLYYNNGFWDNYRTTWPLMTLLDPAKTTEMIEGLLYHYEDNFWIPRWTSAIGMNCMCGTSTDIIFGDAIARGIELDEELLQEAYEASLKNATVITEANAAGGRDGLDEYTFLGYITDEGASETALSWALAGYYNDYGIAQLAKAAGDEDVYQYMMERCLNYVNMFDTEHEWFRGIEVDAETEWAEDLNPFFYDGDYMESYAWIMAFDAPYDGQGLVNLYGSREDLEAKLDQVFNTYGQLIWDHEENRYSGPTHELLEVDQIKMGMYEHNNQPAHHIPYMYLYAGNPAKTQSTVRQILRQCYTNVQYGGGYSGDDDSGEQSAWYVLSALGLYPLNMGSGELVFGSPLFTKATIHLQNGNDIVINAPENSPENVYVGSVTVNGEAYDKTSISQKELTKNGAVIEFAMTDTPSDWGTGEDAAPTSITVDDEVPAPLKDHTKGESALFDNTAATSEAVSGSVTYEFATAKNVSMLTLTAATASDAPASFALYGSNNGEEWVLLEERETAFRWDQQTIPYAVENAGFYTHYRLDTTGTLAEIELMGKETEVSAEVLAAEIARAGALDLTEATAAQVQALHAAMNTAMDADETEARTASFAELTAAIEEIAESGAARAALQSVYEANKDKQPALYGSSATFVAALEKARAALIDENSTLDTLTSARRVLENAAAGLTVSVDYTKSLNYNGTVTVSGQTAAAEAGAYGVNGNIADKWCSTSPVGGYHWLEVDLGTECTVNSWVVLNAGIKEDFKFNTKIFSLQAKQGETWVDVQKVTGNTDVLCVMTLDTPVSGQVFRLLLPNNSAEKNSVDGHARIYEFHVFGEKNSAVVAEAEGKIAAIGAVTEESGTAIADARLAYNDLTAAQQAQVGNYADLTAAEAAYAALTTMLFGDLDGDGALTTADTILLMQYLVEYDVSFATLADINGDGRISIIDAVDLLRKLSN